MPARRKSAAASSLADGSRGNLSPRGGPAQSHVLHTRPNQGLSDDCLVSARVAVAVWRKCDALFDAATVAQTAKALTTYNPKLGLALAELEDDDDAGMSDDERLTDRWEAGPLGRSVSHEERVRVARVLLRRHDRQEATRRLLQGIRANCEAMGVPERFDQDLTCRWSTHIADAMDEGDAETFEDFIQLHPDLLRGDLLGLPEWTKGETPG